MTAVQQQAIATLENQLAPTVRQRVADAVDAIVRAKQRDGKVVVVTGSGPNVHEGVTTLIAELMRLGVVDGVTTSSAVVAHEMGGVLDRVKRVDGRQLELDPQLLPLGGVFELTEMDDQALRAIEREMPLDEQLIRRIRQAPGAVIIKAAGNLGYPMGLWLERLAGDVLRLARARNASFEETVGAGCDARTMLGVGARNHLPVLVTIPQLIGGGAVGLAVGDSISIRTRATRLAEMLATADVIVESAVALTQEIHDGPFETHTGHGLWAAWDGQRTYSLAGKTLVRIDLDPALERAWQAERGDQAVQAAIDQGLPKTKVLEVPFRMEMSGFARLKSSIAVTGDIGVVWPVLAQQVTARLGLQPAWMSYPQQTDLGRAMRDWIVTQIRPVSRAEIEAGSLAVADTGRAS